MTEQITPAILFLSAFQDFGYIHQASRKIYHMSPLLSRALTVTFERFTKMKDWTFVTNHGLVLSYLAEHLQITSREIAAALGITERRVQRIIAGLEQAGYIAKKRNGRYNTYVANMELSMRHPTQPVRAVGDLRGVWKPRSLQNKKSALIATPRLFPDDEGPVSKPAGESARVHVNS